MANETSAEYKALLGDRQSTIRVVSIYQFRYFIVFLKGAEKI